MLLVKAFSLFSYFRFPCLVNKLLKLKTEHASKENHGRSFYFRAQKFIQNWIPRDQNQPIRGF